MLCKIDKFLNSAYRYSGYIASFFLILILVFIVTGIASRIFGFYIRGLTEYSGYSLATASFLALAYTFNENAHIRITLFLEKAKGKTLRSLSIWCLAVSTFFSAFLAFYFIKMWIVSIQLEERSQGADEILIWIPQTGVVIGSIIFFICILHNFLKLFIKKQND
tara:strand:- start:222 stop:713 length:492 start_codon:yes stop_codon:yes gene_type:complete